MKKSLLMTLILITGLGCRFEAKGQSEVPQDNWDNILYYSNKLAWGTDTWRHSTEFQSRYKDDLGALEQWHLEYIATFLATDKLEIVPDFRFTKKPDRVEYRPGFGLVFKQFIGKTQIVQQVKYQYDARMNGVSDSQGVRYGIFLNKVYNEHWIGSIVAGGLFEWGQDFSGFLGLRTGPAVAYIFNEVHSINIGWFYGLLNDKQGGWTHIGIPSFQLIINIRKKYKYTPAKYINF